MTLAALIVLTAALMLSEPSTGWAQAGDRAAVATTPHFAFYSDFAMNLNDAVIAAGAARRAKKAELFQSSSALNSAMRFRRPGLPTWMGSGRSRRLLRT